MSKRAFGTGGGRSIIQSRSRWQGYCCPASSWFFVDCRAQLVIGRDHPWLSDWAVALFAIAAALLVYAMQFSTTALGLAATPSEQLDYNPEAAFDAEICVSSGIVNGKRWSLEQNTPSGQSTATTLACWLSLAALGYFLCLIMLGHGRGVASSVSPS
jgi:hypothetical protein